MSLPVVLALLLGMALLGAAVLQSGLLHTKMAADGHARTLAFEAAESALRVGEKTASSGVIPAYSGCVAGLCGAPDAGDRERWREPGFAGWQALPAVPDIGLPAAAVMVEYLGPAPSLPGCERAVPMAETCLRPLYRITARSQGARVAVMLQSHYLDARVSWREVGIE